MSGGDALGQAGDVVARGRRQVHVGEPSVCCGHKDARGRDAVKVHVRVQGGPEFLYECDRAGLGVGDADLTGAVPLPGEDALQKALQHS